MNVKEAALEWGVKEDTIMKYILKGYIYGLAVENNEIVFPEIGKPYTVVKSKKDNDGIDKAIIAALNKNNYLNAKILGIKQNIFEQRLGVLLKEGKIHWTEHSEPNYESTNGFAIASSVGEKKNITIFEAKIEAKGSVQVGLANVSAMF